MYVHSYGPSLCCDSFYNNDCRFWNLLVATEMHNVFIKPTSDLSLSAVSHSPKLHDCIRAVLLVGECVHQVPSPPVIQRRLPPQEGCGFRQVHQNHIQRRRGGDCVCVCVCVCKIISIQLEELLLSYIIRNDTLARNTYEKIKVQSSQQ